MKIAVLGATGGTGLQVVEQALARGHAVVAFARSPQKLGIEHDKLTVVQGDILDGEKVAEAVAGTQAVVSALGPGSNKAQFVVSRGMEHILTAMQQHGVKRLVASAGAGVGDPDDKPGLMNKFINLLLKTISRNVYEDMLRVVELIRASDVDWTIVRAPRLVDEPLPGEVKAAWVGKGMGMQLYRGDFAAFMLDQLEDDSYVRQAPALSNV